MNVLEINKRKLKCLVGVIEGTEGSENYKNTVISYADGIPIFIKTNLNQEQWDRFCNGKLTEEELKKVV